MNCKKSKFVLILICVVSLLFSGVRATAAAGVTVSVDAGTIGAGCLIPPTLCDVSDGENAAAFLSRIITEAGYSVFYGGEIGAGFYLAYIADGTKGGSFNGYRSLTPAHPENLNLQVSFSPEKEAYLSENAAYFDKNDYEENFSGYLGEFVFTDASGWMYELNGEFVQTSLSEITLKEGDTLRLRFTLLMGRDLEEGSGDRESGDGNQESQTTNPEPRTTEPVPQTTAPAPQTTEPVPQTTEPVPQTTAPAPQTTEPVPQTTAPAPQTTAPAPQTTEPVPQTTAPAPQTTNPGPRITVLAIVLFFAVSAILIISKKRRKKQ